jgi:hypothetical protein
MVCSASYLLSYQPRLDRNLLSLTIELILKARRLLTVCLSISRNLFLSQKILSVRVLPTDDVWIAETIAHYPQRTRQAPMQLQFGRFVKEILALPLPVDHTYLLNKRIQSGRVNSVNCVPEQ